MITGKHLIDLGYKSGDVDKNAPWRLKRAAKNSS